MRKPDKPIGVPNYMCTREVTYGQHPDVAYKLMELRQQRASCTNLPTGATISDPRYLGTISKAHPPHPTRVPESLYGRISSERLGNTSPVSTTKCQCDKNCQGCIYDKESGYILDLIRHDEPLRDKDVTNPPDTQPSNSSIQDIPSANSTTSMDAFY